MDKLQLCYLGIRVTEMYLCEKLFSVSLLNSVSLPKQFEHLALNVCKGNSTRLTVVGIYGPPSEQPCAKDKLAELLSNYWMLLQN